MQGDWPFQQLPVMLQRIELKDELSGVREEIVVVIFVSKRVRFAFYTLVEVDQMSSSPIALDESPTSCNKKDQI